MSSRPYPAAPPSLTQCATWLSTPMATTHPLRRQGSSWARDLRPSHRLRPRPHTRAHTARPATTTGASHEPSPLPWVCPMRVPEPSPLEGAIIRGLPTSIHSCPARRRISRSRPGLRFPSIRQCRLRDSSLDRLRMTTTHLAPYRSSHRPCRTRPSTPLPCIRHNMPRHHIILHRPCRHTRCLWSALPCP